MEFGQHQMQVAVTVAMILGAAIIALMCDLLKRNNEQLRELALELKNRQGFQPFTEPETPRQARPIRQTKPIDSPAEDMPVESAAAEPPKSERPSVRAEVRNPSKRAIAPEALAAMQRGAQLAASPRPPRTAVPVPEEKSVPPTPQKSEPAPRDWNLLLSVRRPPPPQRRKKSRAASALPAGFQDGFVLTRLVESHQPVSGLVVSIGASALMNPDGSMPATVRELVQSLLGPNDFAAQSGSEEFLLIYPSEQGASAQRKLSQISEQLWDFQLRSTGTVSILFSWGGVEVRSESIEEAIASATERMQETRRNRKILTMESKPDTEAPLGRAV